MALSITQRNDTDQLFARAGDVLTLPLAEGQRHPAGIQPQHGGGQDQPFPVVARPLLQGWSTGPDQGQIVFDVAEFSVVGQHAAESLRFAGDQLDMQPALYVAGAHLPLQGCQNLAADRLVRIAAHGMAALHRFQ